jgi:hypothetical protein
MVALPSSLAKTKPKSSKNANAIRAKKETTVVAYATTVLGIMFITEGLGFVIQL